MDNLFFGTPGQGVTGGKDIEIVGQEAQHISKVMRQKTGDVIYVADGVGTKYRCELIEVTKHTVRASILDQNAQAQPAVKKILAMGVIKKRDRLEFAVEKAVELGAWQICLFNAARSERSKVNIDRLQALVLSAFKQSTRYWLPALVIKNSLEEVFMHYQGAAFIMAHEKEPITQQPVALSSGEHVLMVGPEGGFSNREVELCEQAGGEMISLGQNRLRAETSVTAILSQYLFC